MHVLLAWFATRPQTPESRGRFRTRFETSVRGLVPDSYQRVEAGGEDWGVTVLHPGPIPATRWDAVAAEGSLTAVPLGVPIGAPATETALTMARRLLAGESVHREVVPPFGLLAIDGSGTFAMQQDWLGMCRIFTAQADGVTVLGTRPSMVGTVVRGSVEPDLEAWRSYACCGHFAGDMSPIRGVRLLSPGERMTGRREPGGGWAVRSEIGHGLDDVVLAGIEALGRPLDDTLTVAADAFAATAAQTDDRYEQVMLPLSGGKDSRLIAASLVAAGRVPRLHTYDDIRAEGETARELVRILREKRGIEVVHTVRAAAQPENVLTTGLRERTLRLQRRYDYQFPTAYVTRPAKPELLPAWPATATISGAAGELAVGFWYAKPGADDETQMRTATAHLMGNTIGIRPEVVEQERARVAAVWRHAREIGLRGEQIADYLFLYERVRRWSSSAYAIKVVTPFLSPAVVAATFALTPDQKRAKVMQVGLTERLVPEWAGVPFVGSRADPSKIKTTVAPVWSGDGAEVIADLMDTAHGRIVAMLDRGIAEKMLVERGVPAGKCLQRFTYLALASHQLEPDGVHPSTGATHRRLTTPPPPPPRRNPIFRRMRWVKKTAAGRAVWTAVRSRVRR